LPLSGMKATFLEGGIRVPGIISYPGVIEANTRYSQPISFLDFFPTFTNLAGCQPTTNKDLDGVDILPFITGTNTNRPHQTLFWKCENRGALRDGDMKFMRFPDRPAELYDLSKDVGEHNNLASSHPELIKRYYKMLFDWEMTLDRPRWMLERKYEKRVIKEYYDREDYRYPKEQL
ncbi:MAG: sulfatase/phosphatase domain-containing protein, partial [Rikenellaceae bacterium]